MSNARADSHILNSLTAYEAMLGLSSGQTARWENLLAKIIEAPLMHVVVKATGCAEGYALGLRDAGVITGIQRDRMARVAMAVAAEQIQRLPDDA
ncbi:hypothetical protein D3C85_1591110 [compost metagenome]